MGDWRRVQIVGTCTQSEVPALRAALTMDRNYENFHALVNTGGICGLPNWANEQIGAVGNLAERGYDPNSVAECLDELAIKVPILSVKVHVSDHNEADNCVATVTIQPGQPAAVGSPEVETIPQISKSTIQKNLFAQLMGG